MSDAQGSRNDGDEPVEEQAGAAPESDAASASAQTPGPEGDAPKIDFGADEATGPADATVGPDAAAPAEGSGEAAQVPTWRREGGFDAARRDDTGDDPEEAPATLGADAAAPAGGPDLAADRSAADATVGPDAAAPGDPAAVQPAGDPTDDDPAEEEPDYEALAAELDRLEAETAAAAPVAPGAREPEPTDTADPWFEPAQTQTFRASDAEAEQAAGETRVIDEPASVTASEPTAHAAPAPSPGPIFVQAPEPPRKRGNRGAAGLIGLPAAVVFGLLFAGVSYLWQLFIQATTGAGVLEPVAFATEVLAQPPFWFTVVAFWLAFWLLGVFVNRARWWAWTVLGLIVALLTYVGHLGGVFLDAPFWNLTAAEGTQLLVNSVFTPMALVSVILSREVTIWFGAWVSRRGQRITKLNAEEREEYDRLMADGPKAPDNA